MTTSTSTSKTKSCNWVTPRPQALIKRHGGKFYLCRRIIGQLKQPATTVAETFVGGGSFFFNLAPHMYKRAIINDIDPQIVNLLRVVRDNIWALQSRLAGIEYCELTFERWRDRRVSIDLDPLEAAMRYFIVNRMSRGGLGKAFAWSERLRGGKPGDLNAWNNAVRGLPVLSEKLRMVDIRCEPAWWTHEEILDDPLAVLYLDPPYDHSTRKIIDGVYDFEMGEAEHIWLLTQARQARCRVMISGYPCWLYDTMLAGWRRVTFNMPNHSGQSKQKERRTEVLWINF